MKKLMLETVQPSGRVREEDVTDIQPESRIGQFFYPSGVKGVFGQVVRVAITYTDGHTRTYSVKEVE